MTATLLGIGDLGLIGVNTQDTVPGGTSANDLISFMLLAPIGSGTTIYFTDRSWNGTTFAAAGGGEGTYTFTAASDMAAGSVVTITAAQLSGAGMSLSEAGETIYVYQGTNANTPTKFLTALELGDGNTTFNGNLTNTGLVAGVSALALSVNNAEFGTRTSNINAIDLFAQINNNTDWVQNDNSMQDGSATGTPAYTAPDAQIWVAGSGAGESITTINLDGTYSSGTLGYQIVQAFQNDANLFHPSDITLDTVHGKFFFVDSDISGGHNRIVEGSISQLLNNPGAALTFTILYADDSATAPQSAHAIRTLSVDTANGIVYFDHGTTFNKVTYALSGSSTANQTPTVLANLGTNNFVTQMAIDYTHGEVYLGSSRITATFGTDVINKNYVYVASGLTSSSTTLTFSQLPFNPDDNGLGGEGGPLSGEAWPVERGNIRGIDVDPVNHDLYIVTGSVTLDNDGDGNTTYPGGVYKYDLDSNATGTVTTLFTQNGATGPLGLMYYIEVDPTNNRYYVIDATGTNADPGDGGVWTGSTSAAGTPTLVGTVGNVNGLGPQGLEIQHAPTLSGTNLAAGITETDGNPSANPAEVTTANGFSSTDTDSAADANNDQLAGAQVRVSGNFQHGAGHADQLIYSGALSSGTNQNGSISIGGDTVTFSYNANTGTLTFSGVTTFDNYEAILNLVQYRVDGDNPTNYGYAPTRTISYSTFDGLLYSDEVNATVTVTGLNDAPINSVPGEQTFDEDTARVFSTGNGNALSVSDVDADPAAQELRVTLSVDLGTLTLGSVLGLTFTNGDGSDDATMTFTGTANSINAALGTGGLTYNPVADYNGGATLTFTVNDQGFNGNDPGHTGDGTSEQDTDTVTLTINAVADIADDSTTFDEDSGTYTLTMPNNDTFENTDRAITSVTQGAHGTVTINDNGTPLDNTDDFIVYTQNPDYNGTDSFTYTVTSGGVTETATANVTINAVADIADDSATVGEDTIGTFDLLGNDSFEDSGRAITAVGAATHGIATINDNNTAGDATDDYVQYTPDPDYNGTDSFTYTVTSGDGVTETATVNVTVTAEVDIADDNVTVDEDSGINSLDLLANDSFEDSGRSITGVGAATNGTAALNDNGTVGDTTDDYVTYTPNADYFGSDSFTYTVTSGGVTETATVNVTVNPVNDAPTSTGLDGDSVTFTEGDTSVLIDMGGDATVSDIDSADFDTGSLTVGVTAGGVSAEDVLSIRNQGTGAGQIGVSGTDVTYGGTTIGSFAGGSGGTNLVITFNASADAAAVAALMHNIEYANSAGDDPTDGDRTIGWVLIDGDGTANSGSDTLNLTSTVNVDPVDDAPVAYNDAVTALANAVLNGDVTANNGSGADTDPDGPLEVALVNGSGGNVGSQFTLASGAKLTVNSDGTFAYDPNGKYDYLVSAATGTATGAVNTTATDGFDYDLNGGNNAVVTITVNGVDGAGDELWGDGTDNSMTGTGGDDFFRLSQGGEDSANGGTGTDAFYMGAAFSSGDSLAGGGGGFDQVGLQGNYGAMGAPFVLGPTSMTDMDILVFLSGSDSRFGDMAGNSYDYYITMDDGNVDSGELLYVSWNALKSGEDVVFDGSAELDGSFITYAGQGNDTIIGSQQADGFYFGMDALGSTMWGAGDSVDGQVGTNDQLGLQGNYAGANAVVFGATQLTNIDMIVCITGGDARFGMTGGDGYSYDLTMDDGNLAGGATMYISANTLRAAGGALTADEVLTFDGSGELDGAFVVYGGHGADSIVGGAGDDEIWGGDGADSLTGGAGTDSFHYGSATQSTASATDQILDFSTGETINLSTIDAKAGGANDSFDFIGSTAFSNQAGELRVEDMGGGVWQVEGDTDGDGVANLVISVTTDHALGIGDFVL